MRYLSVFFDCGWAYGFTFSLLPLQTLPHICESWVKSDLMLVCEPCNYALVEVVEPFKLHPTPMWYIYERFECLVRLWMGVWLQTHTVTTTDASPDLGKLAEILPDASVQTVHKQFGWGCRTSNCIPGPWHTYIWCLSIFSGCGWAYGFTLTPLAPQILPQIWRGWLKT